MSGAGAELVVLLEGAAATEAAGRALAAGIRAGDLLELCGDLGAGKTTLVRGLAAGLGVDPVTVRSPTFVLHHVYPGRPLTLHHLDLYRLGTGADISGLDLDGLTEDGVVAVEWADLAPPPGLRGVRIDLDAPSEQTRRLRLPADAPDRLRRALVAGAPA